MQQRESERAILFYDGACGFCSGVVQFLLPRDRAKRLSYAPLYGQTMQERGIPTIRDETIILVTENGIYYKSDAVIHILKLLGGRWSLLGRMIALFPKKQRDFLYDKIGKIRYRLAGKADRPACETLPQGYRDRLLP